MFYVIWRAQRLRPAPTSKTSFVLLYLFLTIPVRPLLSRNLPTGPIFAKFSGSVELWLPMISLKLVFESVKGRRHGNHFYCRCAQAASGAVGRANVWLYRASTWHGIGGVAVLTEAQVKRRH